MAGKCEIFMYFSKRFVAVKINMTAKPSTAYEIINVKEQIFLANVKYLYAWMFLILFVYM